MRSYGSDFHQGVVSVEHQSIEEFIGRDDAIESILRVFETLMEGHIEGFWVFVV